MKPKAISSIQKSKAILIQTLDLAVKPTRGTSMTTEPSPAFPEPLPPQEPLEPEIDSVARHRRHISGLDRTVSGISFARSCV